MKYCVALDSDGHFELIEFDDRPKVIKLLKDIQDDDYWANTADEVMEDLGVTTEAELLTLGVVKWGDFVRYFEQRATMEIKTI